MNCAEGVSHLARIAKPVRQTKEDPAGALLAVIAAAAVYTVWHMHFVPWPDALLPIRCVDFSGGLARLRDRGSPRRRSRSMCAVDRNEGGSESAIAAAGWFPADARFQKSDLRCRRYHSGARLCQPPPSAGCFYSGGVRIWPRETRRTGSGIRGIHVRCGCWPRVWSGPPPLYIGACII